MTRRLLIVCALVGASMVAAVPAQAVIPPDTHCRSGKVSITFDDGPHRTNTAKLLRILRENHAQATFFVQGANARRYPTLIRKMVRDGHAVENHSWDHPRLTRLSDSMINSEIKRTSTAIRKYTAVTPKFMRPPYGATNGRVKRAIRKQHLRQELWTIDTNDWRGGSATSIKKAALRGLRKHRSNVILMHDAVANSPRTIQAVPAVIRGLRRKGYCLVPLQVTAPNSRLKVAPIRVNEGTRVSTRVTVHFRLSAPSQRAARFRVRTVPGTASAGTDYTTLAKVISLRRGGKTASVTLTIFSDPKTTPSKSFRLVLDRAKNLTLVTKTIPITLTDNGVVEPVPDEVTAPQ